MGGLGLGKGAVPVGGHSAGLASDPSGSADAASGARAAVLGRIGAAVNARADAKVEPAWSEALALRDGQIAELQQAVIELANMVDAQTDADKSLAEQAGAAMDERIAAIEQRMIEQDRTIRHTLTMLIEWIERDAHTRAAA